MAELLKLTAKSSEVLCWIKFYTKVRIISRCHLRRTISIFPHAGGTNAEIYTIFSTIR